MASTPFHLILRSQSPSKRAQARHSAQGITAVSIAKRCNAAWARLGGSLRARREAAICVVARA